MLVQLTKNGLNKLRVSLVMFTTVCILAAAVALVGCSGNTGTYVYSQDSKWSIEVKSGDEFAVHFGENLVSGTYQENGGTYTFSSKSRFNNFRFTGTFEGSKLIVTGDLEFKNAQGKTDPSSLMGLKDAVFEK